MRYLSLCSGIEAASVAWEPLGWQAVAFSEIEAFPCAVLKHHYPDTPNWGDMTRFKEWPDATIDLLVGGTPCQSFSVAGLRKGLDDPRGNLMLTYLAIAGRYRPRWLVWENVPGVLSADKGSAFGTFLSGLAELGYGFAYRILDAQYFGVPQRRRRVFVVGHLGDWRRAAAVLFERHSLSGDQPPRREARQDIAGTFKACAGSGGWSNSADHAAAGYMQAVAPTLNARTKGGGGLGTDFDCDGGLVATQHASRINCQPGGIAGTVIRKWAKGAGGPAGDEHYNLITHSLRGAGFDASEDGTGRGTPIVPIAIHPHCIGRSPEAGPQGKEYLIDGSAYTMDSTCQPQAVAFDLRGRDGGAMPEGAHDTANIRAASGGSSRSYIAQPLAVRRLMPIECERLQGFPDGYTRIPIKRHAIEPKNKHFARYPDIYDQQPDGSWIQHAADGPRYKALGNSMAVPVMRWIGERISMVDALINP